MFDAVTKVNYLGEPYTALPALPSNGWAILGLLRSRPFTPVLYEDLAAAINQDPTLPVYEGRTVRSNPDANGFYVSSHSSSKVYRMVYLIRRHLTAANSLDRIIRVSPFPGAPRGGFMYLPSTRSRK